jgi:hypothetical protein
MSTTTHRCTHCHAAVRPHLSGWPGTPASLLWQIPGAWAIAVAAIIAAPVLFPGHLELGMLAFGGALALALIATAGGLVALARPRRCPQCGATRPVRLSSPRGRQISRGQHHAA